MPKIEPRWTLGNIIIVQIALFGVVMTPYERNMLQRRAVMGAKLN